jgi:NCAIR mutase (PurE)-related protein
MDFANIDFEREARTGYPEVVYCAGKTTSQCVSIIHSMREHGVPVFATRASAELARAVSKEFHDAEYDSDARTIGIACAYGDSANQKARTGLVVVAAAGTSDYGTAKEAVRTAEFFGSNVIMLNDIGIAGIHRLFENLDTLKKARCVVAAAGMEGTLPGVIAGLIRAPVIALPTSVGYGANFTGLSALLAMLTSCAPGISVVNIDNGFGAGYQANLINQITRTYSCEG